MARRSPEEYRMMHEREDVIHYRFRKIGYLADAMCVDDISEKTGVNKEYSNGSMGTLGDVVLKLMISEGLFAEGKSRSEITEAKQLMESNETFHGVVERLGIHRFAFNDSYFFEEAPEEKQLPHSRHDGYLEAIVAAVYLDAGYNGCRKWFKDFLLPVINAEVDRQK